MNIKTLIPAAAFALAAAGCAGSTQHQAGQTAALQCARVADASEQVTQSLFAGNVHSAEPVHFQRVYFGGPQADHVIGAKLSVPAEAGQTEAYLERAMACHLASGRASGHPNDPLAVDGVQRVEVRGSGSSFEVSIIGRDKQAGEAIWERAHALEAQIGVRQLAANGTTAAF